MRPAWVASAYKPVYYVVRKYNANPKDRRLAVGLASFAVFMVSGLTHEYSVLCNIGWNAYKKYFIGQQMVFFGIHGLFVVLEKTLFFVIKPLLPTSFTTSRSFELLRRLYVIGFFTITFPIFINPYAHWGFHHLGALTPIESTTRQFLLSKPFLRQISGSAL
jgi:hypothetical protein